MQSSAMLWNIFANKSVSLFSLAVLKVLLLKCYSWCNLYLFRSGVYIYKVLREKCVFWKTSRITLCRTTTKSCLETTKLPRKSKNFNCTPDIIWFLLISSFIVICSMFLFIVDVIILLKCVTKKVLALLNEMLSRY